jgi:hypothetical protein
MVGSVRTMERFAFSVLAGWLVLASGADGPTSELSTLLAGVNQARVRGRDCANLMNPCFQEMRAGKALNRSAAYGTYWSQVFGAPR